MERQRAVKIAEFGVAWIKGCFMVMDYGSAFCVGWWIGHDFSLEWLAPVCYFTGRWSAIFVNAMDAAWEVRTIRKEIERRSCQNQ